MATGPARVIDAPLLTPPPNGLLRSATVIDEEALHFGSALEWPAENCADLIIRDPCGTAAKPITANHPGTIRYDAFLVDAYDTCSAFAYQAADYEGRARRALAARETKAVESEWWTGTLFAANPHLARGGYAGTNGPATTTLAGGTAQSLAIGLALLVQYLADLNGGTGMIHARPYLAELWFSHFLIWRDNSGKLWTGNGNLIVPGAGYPGTSPTGAAISTTSEWAFATDAVEVHRGPVEVFAPRSPQQLAEVLDRTTNTVTVRAERLYALTTNGCVNAAVNINPNLTA